MSRGARSFFATAMFAALVVGLLGCLTVFEVPSGNKEFLIAGFSTLIGGLTASLNRLLSQADDDLVTQKRDHDREMQQLRLELAEMKAEYDTLKAAYDRITRKLVSETTKEDSPEYANTQPMRP